MIPGWGDTKRLHGNKAAEDSDAAPRGRTRFLALRAKRPLHQPCVPAHAALRRSAPPPPRPPSLTGGGQGRPHTPAARPPGHRERRLELELTQPRESAQRLQRSGAPRGSEARGRGFRARSGGRSPARPGRVGRRQGHRHSRSAGRGPPAPGASRAGAPRRHPCAVLAALWTACSRGRPGGLLRCTWRSGRVQAPPPGPSWWQDPHCGTRKESVCEPSPTPPGAQRLARPRPLDPDQSGPWHGASRGGEAGLLQLIQAGAWGTGPLVDQRGGICSLMPLSQGGAPTLGTPPSDGRPSRESPD